MNALLKSVIYVFGTNALIEKYIPDYESGEEEQARLATQIMKEDKKILSKELG